MQVAWRVLVLAQCDQTHSFFSLLAPCSCKPVPRRRLRVQETLSFRRMEATSPKRPSHFATANFLQEPRSES